MLMVLKKYSEMIKELQNIIVITVQIFFFSALFGNNLSNKCSLLSKTGILPYVENKNQRLKIKDS